MVGVAKPGTTLRGKYRLEAPLGEGGMGVVYRATHLRLERPVAIKLLKPEVARDERILTRFFEEARAAGKLRHPHVIDMLDVDMDGETPFMVMELLEGEPLSALLEREGPLSVARALALIEPVLDALEAAHEAGIVHRDIKPDNVFVAEVGGATVPKVLDFGIARLWDGGAALTDTGVAIGTPMYMAPEQAAGRREAIGPWTDVWSVGVVLFEALTGARHLNVSSSAGMMAWLTALATERPRRLADVAPEVPSRVAEAIDAALDTDPDARPRDAAALRARLFSEPSAEGFGLADTVRSVPPPSSGPVPSAPSRAWLWAAVGTGLLALGGLGAGALLMNDEPTPEEPAARAEPATGTSEAPTPPARDPSPAARPETDVREAPAAPTSEAQGDRPDEVDGAPSERPRTTRTRTPRPTPRARPAPARGSPPSSGSPTSPPPRTRTGRWNSDDY